MSTASFVLRCNWVGGFYELAIELGDRDDDRLGLALSTCWDRPGVEGCYLHTDVEPADQVRLAPTLDLLERTGHLYGLASVSPLPTLVCGCVAVRELSGRDWFCFYLPMGALSDADHRVGAYPIGDADDSLQWREVVDDWLVELARDIFRTVPFELALIGAEVSGEVYARDLGEGVPTERAFGYLVPHDKDLEYFPATC